MANDIVDIIRENLKRRILEGGYPSFERFAHENSIDKTTLSRLLNGKREPKISTLLKITDSLNLTLNDLCLTGNSAREKSSAHAASVYAAGRIKKRRITLVISEAEIPAFQEKLKSARPIVLETRLARK